MRTDLLFFVGADRTDILFFKSFMTTVKFKNIEKFEFAFILLLIVACALGLGKLIFTINFLAVIIIILSVPISHLILKYKPTLVNIKYPTLLLAVLCLTFLCCVKIISSNGKDVANITKLFVKGKVTHAEELDKSGEGNPGYDTYYSFEAANGDQTVELIIGWGLFILCSVILWVNYHYVRTAQKLLPE